MALGGCSYTFGVEPEDVRLVGAPADRSALDRVPLTGYPEPLFTQGADGAVWAVGPYYSDVGPTLTSALCVRLEPPISYVEIESLATITPHALYRLGAPLDLQGTLDLIRLHPERDEQRFPAPRQSLGVLESDDGKVVALIGGGGVELLRLDGSFSRFVSEPGLTGGGGLLDPGGEWLLTRGKKGEAVLHSTRDSADQPLDARLTSTPVPAFDDARAQVVFCDDKGLRALSFDGVERVLDPQPCSEGKSVGQVLLGHGWAYYRSPQGALEGAPLDGAGPPRELAGPDAGVLALGPGLAAVATAGNPPWAGQASDGWLDGHRFMERGSHVSFSRDGARLRWLEHAADDDAVGELRSIAVADLSDGKRSLLLARNVIQYAELDDGRVLAIANRAFEGQQSRLEVIDEEARTARPIVTGCKRFVRVPGDHLVLATLLPEQVDGDDVIVVAPLEARGAPTKVGGAEGAVSR